MILPKFNSLMVDASVIGGGVIGMIPKDLDGIYKLMIGAAILITAVTRLVSMIRKSKTEEIES